MVDSESIKEVKNQVAAQVATGIMMAFRDMETGPPEAKTQDQWGKSKMHEWTDTGETRIQLGCTSHICQVVRF